MNLQRLVGEVEINLAPLQDNPFTDCKSELKFFEAAAVGTLSIASPTFAFRAAIAHGSNGFLAPAHRWLDTLREAIACLPHYASLAEVAREAVLARYAPAVHARLIANTLFSAPSTRWAAANPGEGS